MTPAVLRDTVKDIFCIYKLKGDKHSVCFVSNVVEGVMQFLYTFLFLCLDENSLAEL